MSFILIVDGDECSAERGADALIAAGHSCGWVTDAEQAKILLRWRKPDVLLLDEQIARISKEDILQELHANNEYPDPQVIVLATSSASSDADEPLACGVHDDICKPFDPRFLVWRVNLSIEMREAKPRREKMRQKLTQQHEKFQRRSLA